MFSVFLNTLHVYGDCRVHGKWPATDYFVFHQARCKLSEQGSRGWEREIHLQTGSFLTKTDPAKPRKPQQTPWY